MFGNTIIRAINGTFFGDFVTNKTFLLLLKNTKNISKFRPAINIESKLVKYDNTITIYTMIKNVYTTKIMTKESHIMLTDFEEPRN